MIPTIFARPYLPSAVSQDERIAGLKNAMIEWRDGARAMFASVRPYRRAA